MIIAIIIMMTIVTRNMALGLTMMSWVEGDEEEGEREQMEGMISETS
jgi:hypothetical protein